MILRNAFLPASLAGCLLACGAPLLADEEGVALLPRVPAVRARIARIGRDEMTGDVDPRTAGTTLLELSVEAGRETSAQLPD